MKKFTVKVKTNQPVNIKTIFPDQIKMIDIRSDTVTLPTSAMRESILTCPVGDDVFQDDPTSIKLEQLTSNLLGKEAALFFPSGTMANQIALMCAIDQRGDEVLLPKDSHMFQSEAGAIGVLSGGMVKFLKQNPQTEEVDVEDLRKIIKKTIYDFLPRTSIIGIENPTSNGLVISIENMKQVYEVANQWKVHVHLDGARIFNAQHYLGVEAKEIAKYCDSIMISVSKGLCCPVGSLLGGTKEFIAKARRFRKMMGGTLRQVGVLAQPAIIGLTNMIEPLKVDHEMAQRLANGLNQYDKILSVGQVHVNIIKFQFLEGIKVDLIEMEKFFLSKGIKIKVPLKITNKIRLMTHHYIRDKEVEHVLQVFKEFFEFNIK